ncbi:S9 family peptidase [Pontixanthobacter gangjinensis]|uniref:Prolyl oligopeptidase family serine peptidase n=1 Tax=Pontixanthobacter gangjinensis TaxID=1028742 RepID=A0A6I4SLL5_9SPHN|nr:prolyl oligopeptidase family serine peptidase [Pontixanthobacter gangjinensis]MXO56619.1 prolyl oligopeptidase family serine peptidase [Pontixanthobacter gangjinensis]
MFRRLVLGCAAVLGNCLSVASYAQEAATIEVPTFEAPVLEAKPPIIPVEAFADNSNLSSAKLSPSGDKFIARVELEGISYIVLFDAETRQPTGKISTGDKIDLEWFRWAGNDKILFSVSKQGKFFGDDVRYTRLYSVNLIDFTQTYIGRKEPIVEGDNVIHVADDGSYALVSMQRTIYDYPSVFKFELSEDGSAREIQTRREGVWTWVADSAGVVRIGYGWSRNRMRIYYRSNDDNDLDMVGKFKEDEAAKTFWDVAYVKPGSDLGYVLEGTKGGRVALKTFDFGTRESVETVYENEKWDLDLVTFTDDGQPQYAAFTDDRDQIVWFTEEDKRRQRMLERALPQEMVRITSQAANGSRMLVWAGGENDPGALYVFTPETKRLDQFTEMRSQVNFEYLARPMAVDYEARDGTEIRAYLTLPRGREAKGLPLIIMPHGGPYGVRDQLRYDDDVQLLANRGYAVLQPNYRGSGGYGRAFSRLGNGQIGRKMQDDLDDAMDWAVKQGFAAADRVCVVGGSYGGYAALWAIIRNPERYQCAASWAGVTDWDSQLKYDADFFSRKGGKRWRERVEGEDDFDLDEVSPAEFGEKLNRPVLLAHGEDDNNVPFSQFKKMRNATKNAPMPPELLVIEDEGHSFSKPENKKIWYDRLIAFLEKNNPAD